MVAVAASQQENTGVPATVPLDATRLSALPALCRRFRVRHLDLFGSATDGSFDPARSDLDFLVAFEDMPDTAYADAYFGLRDGLASLFGQGCSTLLIDDE